MLQEAVESDIFPPNVKVVSVDVHLRGEIRLVHTVSTRRQVFSHELNTEYRLVHLPRAVSRRNDVDEIIV